VNPEAHEIATFLRIKVTGPELFNANTKEKINLLKFRRAGFSNSRILDF
jgi:hypothetical protein